MNAIHCELLDEINPKCSASSKIGGKPCLPKKEGWFYVGNGDKSYPLVFVAQINLEDVAKHDKEHVLPEKGMLYFFYDFIEESIGCHPEDKEHFKVFYHEGELSELEEKDYPENLQEDFRIPEFAIKFSMRDEVPMCEEYNEITDGKIDYDDYNYEVARVGLDYNHDQEIFKLLGYADLCQGSMLIECEMVSNGINCGDFEHLPLRTQYSEKATDWILLFQVDIISNAEFELMIGDTGRLYYYIRKEDLKNKRFEKCWFMTQSL